MGGDPVVPGEVVLLPLGLAAVVDDIGPAVTIAPVGEDADVGIAPENDDIPRLPLVDLRRVAGQ